MEPLGSSGKQKDQTAKKPASAPRAKVDQGDKPGSSNQQIQPGKSTRQNPRNPAQGGRKRGETNRKQSVMGLPDESAGPSDVDAQAMPATAIAENPGKRHQKISVAAYARAERRGFEPGKEEEDWLTAEAELYGGDYIRDGEARTSRGIPRREQQREQRNQNDSQ